MFREKSRSFISFGRKLIWQYLSSVVQRIHLHHYYRPHPKDGEGTVFTGVCLSTLLGRGGVTHVHPAILPLVSCPFHGMPHLHPIIVPLVPCPFQGVRQCQVGGTPAPGRGVSQSQVGGTPGQVMLSGNAVPHAPPGQDWGTSPSQDRTGVTTPLPGETEQQSEYLLRGGRYASCVHPGGIRSKLVVMPRK